VVGASAAAIDFVKDIKAYYPSLPYLAKELA
jgi:hypothetical protein